MRIEDVKTFLVGGSWRNWLIVKVETDEGLHGVGEGTLEGKSATVATAVEELKRYLVGQDPFAIEKHYQEMYRRAFYAGGAVLMSAISGVETALWDLKGKALGVPVYELLGGRTRERVKLYANAWYRPGMSPRAVRRGGQGRARSRRARLEIQPLERPARHRLLPSRQPHSALRRGGRGGGARGGGT